uniref:Methyltransferase like 21e n=1 Tax=Lates calcarifer TaxID=8187 RepID=A0A4W6DA70_LATCA
MCSLVWRSASKSPQMSMELYSGPRSVQTCALSQSLAAVLSPASELLTCVSQQAMVLCHFLETNRDKYNLTDKNVIELGAGTGLVTIVSSLLGAKVTSTDLPDVMGNLRYNVMRNTKDRCKYIPLVTELTWGQEVEQRFPRATHCFDYILAADVVYAHPYLDELMDTFDYLCQENTQILWAMRFRLDPENSFVDRFRQRFHLEELYDLRTSLSIKLYRAWRKDKTSKDQGEAAA